MCGNTISLKLKVKDLFTFTSCGEKFSRFMIKTCSFLMFGNTTSLKLEVKDLLTFTSCGEKFCTSWPAMSRHYFRLPLLSYSSLYLSSLSSVTSHRWGKQSHIQLSYMATSYYFPDILGSRRMKTIFFKFDH